jgi:hypothetical protein
LAPTRELALQTQKVFLDIGQYMDIKCHVCIGGRSIDVDVEQLKEGVHIVVGTPGRLLHLLKLNALVMDRINLFCLDEADEMLSRGFKHQIMKGESSLALILQTKSVAYLQKSVIPFSVEATPKREDAGRSAFCHHPSGKFPGYEQEYHECSPRHDPRQEGSTHPGRNQAILH